MHVFEFSHTLDRNDLSHIWQNLPPKIGTKAEYATSVVEHPLLVNELLGRPSEALSTIIGDGHEPYHIDFPSKLQWMVFKVKQRAKKDYFEQVGKDAEKQTFIRETGAKVRPPDKNPIEMVTEYVPYESVVPFYTSNWPYDHFSLIELAKIQTEVTLGETIKKKTVKKKNVRSRPEEEINFQNDRSGAGLDPEGE
jgi:hypothetical protein